MNFAMWIKRRLRSVLRRGDVESELSDEVLLHLDMETEDLVRQGYSREAARREALLRLGGVDKTLEECRDARGTRLIENLARDVRYGIRSLLRTPGFTIVAILSLALGTGANTAIFQLLDAVRLRPLPVAAPRQLVEIEITGNKDGFGSRRNGAKLSYAMWQQIRDRQQWFAGVVGWSPVDLMIGQPPAQERIHAAYVSGGGFDVLGISEHRGRLIEPADDFPGCAGQAVISHGFWQSHFGGSDNAIGSKLMLAGQRVTVIGVTPPGFFGMEVGQTADVMLPLCMIQPANLLTARDEFWIWGFGRLKPDWSAQRAATYLQGASADWLQSIRPTGFSSAVLERYDHFRLTATSRPNGISHLRDAYETSLWLLFGITGLVLAMACANLANLTLARTLSRGKEIATRLAIGASRRRIVFQFFVESLILAVASSAVGALMAGSLSRALLAFAPRQIGRIQLDPGQLETGFDGRVSAFVCVVAFVLCMVVGLATAWYATRPDAISLAAGSARGATAQRFSFQRLLIAAQISISLVLVVSSLLLVTSFRNLFTLDAGFRQDGILTSYLGLAQSRTPAAAMPDLRQRLLSATREIPGVSGAATSTLLPLNESATTLVVLDPATGKDTYPRIAWVSPGYFATMEIPLLAGRDFNAFDRSNGLPVAIVNELFAKRYFGGGNPVGRSFGTLQEPGYPARIYQVVGVAADTKYSNLREALLPIAYFPDSQTPVGRFEGGLLVIVRTPFSAAQFAERLDPAIKTVNGGIVNLRTRSFREMVVEGLARERLLAWLAGFFGFLALLLVAIGLFGVISYMMSTRRREIGIRIALGADAGSVLRMVLGQTFRLTLIGCAIGVVGGLAVTQLARGVLFEVGPGDPRLFGVSVAVLTMVAVGAAYLPSRSAARTNPVETLRTD